MWRYLRKAKNTKKCEKVDFFNFLAIFRKVVALCGAMWRYLRKAQNTKKCEKVVFSTFWQFSEKWWHYVALCGAISRRTKAPKSVKKLFFFQLFGNFSEK